MICFSLSFWLWCAFYNRSLKQNTILLSKCTSRLANKRYISNWFLVVNEVAKIFSWFVAKTNKLYPNLKCIMWQPHLIWGSILDLERSTCSLNFKGAFWMFTTKKNICTHNKTANDFFNDYKLWYSGGRYIIRSNVRLTHVGLNDR